MTTIRCCAVVPTFENPETIGRVARAIRRNLPDLIIVDDGSSAAGRAACEALWADGTARLIQLPRNQGKGAAMRAGFKAAHELGFSHAFQIDADGQHDLEAIPRFLEAAAAEPNSAIFASPIYDESAPRARRIARKITHFWVNLEVGAGRIDDALIGFRIYPLAATMRLPLRCNRMAFDVESAVLLAWADTPIQNLPVGIRYPSPEEGGRSHFKIVRDNLRLAWLHCRLCTIASIRWCLRPIWRRWQARRTA